MSCTSRLLQLSFFHALAVIGKEGGSLLLLVGHYMRCILISPRSCEEASERQNFSPTFYFSHMRSICKMLLKKAVVNRRTKREQRASLLVLCRARRRERTS